MNMQDMQILRQETGAGLLDCRNAWNDAGGDLEQAIAILREKGMAIAQKKADRVAADGIAFAKSYGDCAVLLELNSETDFVAGNDSFIASVERIADTIARYRPVDLAALLGCTVEGQDITVGELLQRMILMFRENLILRRFEIVSGDHPFAYMHQNGRIGVILNLTVNGQADIDLIRRIDQELALQIAAMNPRYVSRDALDAEALDTIRNDIIAEVDADVSLKDKPTPVKDRIVAGRYEKYLATHCLMEQASIRDESRTVEQQIRAMIGQTPVDVTVTAFNRYERGDGLVAEKVSCPLFCR